MKKCHVCKKEIEGPFGGYHVDNKKYCSECYQKYREKRRTAEVKEERKVEAKDASKPKKKETKPIAKKKNKQEKSNNVTWIVIVVGAILFFWFIFPLLVGPSDDSDVRTYKSTDGTTTKMNQYEHMCKYDACLNFGSYTYNPTAKLCKCYNTKGTYMYSHYFGDDCDVALAYCEDNCYELYKYPENILNCLDDCERTYDACN